jgi:hypothetical protein
MSPVQDGIRTGRRPRLVVAVVLAVVILLVSAGAGITVLVLRFRAERAAEHPAQRAAVTYVERQAGRPGATILLGQWWEGCAIYELGFDGERTTVAVIEADGAWTVARESGKTADTFDTDDAYTREDCLNIVGP